MNKPITILLAMVCCGHLTYAQKLDLGKVRLGVKISVSGSFFTHDIVAFDKNSPVYGTNPFPDYESNMRLTGSIGLTADYPLSERFTLRGELLYNGRGGQYGLNNPNVYRVDTAGNIEPAYDKLKYRIDYIELPLLLQYKISYIEKGYISLYGGIAPGIVARASTKFVYYTGTGNADDVDTKARSVTLTSVRGLNLSPIIGIVSSEDDDKRFSFFSDFRLEYTFFPAFNKSGSSSNDLRTNMFTMSFGFGVRF